MGVLLPFAPTIIVNASDEIDERLRGHAIPDMYYHLSFVRVDMNN
jgi:hypothetical protein